VGIADYKVEEFDFLVRDVDFFRRVKSLRKLAMSMSVCIHHLERTGARAAWLIPLFSALKEDVAAWCEDNCVQMDFLRVETFQTVTNAVENRWHGKAPLLTGWKAPQYLITMMMDPSTAPEIEFLPHEWREDCETVLKWSYPTSDNVHKLLCCYINLGHLKKLEQGGKLDTDDVLKDFISQGILESANDYIEPEEEGKSEEELGR
jgi:hypothetical protein